ncbi:MAG: 30S ribosomal protein S1 [Phototrophicales bacterium]|nr:MAG: 30S ribosomal protein S1 [Phototrophicales bacterium]
MDQEYLDRQPDDSQNDDLSEQEFLELIEKGFDYRPPRRGEIREAEILQINRDRNEIIVELIGAKQDGLVTSKDLEHLDPSFVDSLEVGMRVPVFVLQPRDRDGNLVVSINMGLQQNDWEDAIVLKETEEVVPVQVVGFNKGGILVRWRSLEGFIPASHMVTVPPTLQGQERIDALNELKRTGQPIDVKVIEVNPERRRLIFSEREAQREIRAQRKAELLESLNEGKVVRGTVTGLRDFGAFVNIGDADGLIHVSELAWHRVDHPSDVLSVGDEIDVFILNLDKENNRIALSRKRLLPDPWETADSKYHEGQLVEGTVTNVVDFGAFIALDDGLEGLLHLSEMGDGSLKEPYSYVKKGDRLQLRISRLEPDRRRVGFTQRWGTEIVEGESEGDSSAETTETDLPETSDEITQESSEAAPESSENDVSEDETE